MSMSDVMPPRGSQYEKAGVSIERGDAIAQTAKDISTADSDPSVLSSIGGFAAMHAIPSWYRDPVLVSATDGIGTKLLLGIQYGMVEGLGQDLVAMSVNDIACTGAQPLWFLDYLATSEIDEHTLPQVLQGIGQACKACGCSLIGGETAEMPGLYHKGHFDAAGFAMGVVERAAVIDGRAVCVGDCIVGFGSSGFHSNGFSLIRALMSEGALDVDPHALLAPTVLYPPLTRALKDAGVDVRAYSHITGGGIIGNVVRTLPSGVSASLNDTALRDMEHRCAVMAPLRAAMPLAGDDELRTTFNMGVGMTAVMPHEHSARAMQTAVTLGIDSQIIGQVVTRQSSMPAVAIC